MYMEILLKGYILQEGYINLGTAVNSLCEDLLCERLNQVNKGCVRCTSEAVFLDICSHGHGMTQVQHYLMV